MFVAVSLAWGEHNKFHKFLPHPPLTSNTRKTPIIITQFVKQDILLKCPQIALNSIL